ncbi:MAG: DUF839 domain-containing protein [Anaerolineales bacterium]|nr:DUF839 domain-containing protein [Anaerolineales bacterium]
MVQRYKSLTVLLFGLLLIKVIVLVGDNWTARAAEPETVEVVGALGVIENPSEITFAPVNVPTTAGGKAAIRSTTVVTINQQVFPINYHTLIQTGDEFASGTFGLVLDKEGNPILDEDGEPSISSSVDYTSFLPRGDKIYLVSHIETTPSVVYMTTAVQDPETGHLTALDTAPVDFSAVNGVLEACAGVTTAWSTHLGSEEWDPDAKPRDPQTGSIDDEDYDVELLKYFGPEAKLTDVTPYDYGWILEISVDDNGQAKGVKHYAMGRFTHELAYVMPDNRTAYMTDDETNGGIFMFVADKSEDMSAGTLYAAKWLQTSAEGAGSGNLVWIKLGQATDAEIKALIDGGTQFFDMFEEAEPADDGSCAAGYASINTTTGHECLKVKPGMEKPPLFWKPGVTPLC